MKLKTKSSIGVMLIIGILLSIVTTISSSASASSQTWNVVAIGDSYTAGNGALDYVDHNCWKSANAYVEQYSQMARNSGKNIVVKNLACSNATVDDANGQIQKSSAVVSSADIIFMTVGGNDVGFSKIVTRCLAVSRVLYPQSSCFGVIDGAISKLDATVGKVKDTMVSIHKINPEARVVLVGYPYLIAKDCFAVGAANMVRNLQSAVNAKSEAMVTNLTKTQTGYYFAPMYMAFAGGEVCGSGKQLIRGSFDTSPTNFMEWWHPDREGHRVIAKELIRIDLFGSNTPPPAPSYQLPPDSTRGPVYTSLPFECGVVVPYASTYNIYNYRGIVFNHRLSIDFPMSLGTAVVAPESGTIHTYSDPLGYGNYADLYSNSGVIHRMAHLSKFAIANNSKVVRSQTIGYVGSTGASTGPHLHYEQRIKYVQAPINLGGPKLSWGPNQGLSGFRTTTIAWLVEIADQGLIGTRDMKIL